MSPRKKKESALRSYTQEKLDKSLKEAATKPKTKSKKEKVSDVKAEIYKPRTKSSSIGRNAEDDEEWLGVMEKKYADLKKSKAQTVTLTMVQFGFLLEMARE